MTKIDFIRVVRDCGYNDGCEKSRDLIYDFNVVIDDEVRATFNRNVGKGYTLYAPDHELITDHPVPADANPYYHRLEAAKKADFAAIVDGLLQSGRIPAAADVDERGAGAARATAMNREAAHAVVRRRAIAKYAVDAYAALHRVADFGDLGGVDALVKSIDAAADAAVASFDKTNPGDLTANFLT